MVHPAANGMHRNPRELLALLASFPGRTAATTRIAVACTLTVLINGDEVKTPQVANQIALAQAVAEGQMPALAAV